jgi:hypothetical protein
MVNHLEEIFKDEKLILKIRKRLPHLFQLAELESSRAGKIGMEVGSVREKILIAFLIYVFGRENVETQIPITEPEVDVRLFKHPLSIKTITGLGGVKIIWTVDAMKAREFLATYSPKCDTLLALILWGKIGGLYYIPREVQQRVLEMLGRERYIKLPKEGTNPRGVEYSQEALSRLLNERNTRSIEIEWQRSKIEYDPYRRWIDYWKEEASPYAGKTVQKKIVQN